MYIVYTKNNCPNCTQAKNILKSKNMDYEEVNIEYESDAFVAQFMALGHKSMPQIFNEDTQEFVANGHLGLLRLMREGKL